MKGAVIALIIAWTAFSGLWSMAAAECSALTTPSDKHVSCWTLCGNDLSCCKEHTGVKGTCYWINSKISRGCRGTTEICTPKSDKPKVELYVMSLCPYANMAEYTMQPVHDLLGEKVEWVTHYIVSVYGDTVKSLHGQAEADEDMREACVRRDYGLNAYWNFIDYVNRNCGRTGQCWQNAASYANADVNVIQACLTGSGLNLMKADAEATVNAGVLGSPTMFINGVETWVVYKYGKTNSYKEAICAAFNMRPTECAVTLEDTPFCYGDAGGCQNKCNLGTKRCSGDSKQTCEDFNGDGYTEWGGDVPCANGCLDGECKPACKPSNNGCSNGSECCSNKCLYVKACGAYDVRGICTRPFYSWRCQ